MMFNSSSYKNNITSWSVYACVVNVYMHWNEFAIIIIKPSYY